jgi:site-specific DNA-methyltransferase (adenine-specific)
MPEIQLLNIDCMEYMATLADNSFDLAICDPPYGIGISGNPFRGKQQKKEWDNSIPTDEYFKELVRVSKEQIIWGGNYFPLPPSQGFLIWDKQQPQDFSSAMCEFAWMSFQKPAKIYKLHVVTTEPNKIHPTQKPVQLYKWILTYYAESGQRILDTHLGSGSSAIAAHKMGFDFVGCELDKDYYEAACKRFKEKTSQTQLF